MCINQLVPQQRFDWEFDAERSPQHVESSQPAEINIAIPLETIKDISELASEMTKLEKLHAETAKTVEVRSLHLNHEKFSFPRISISPPLNISAEHETINQQHHGPRPASC